MRTLIIVESPAKARTFGNLLSKDYTVKASVGHIRDLPPHEMGVDVDSDLANVRHRRGQAAKPALSLS